MGWCCRCITQGSLKIACKGREKKVRGATMSQMHNTRQPTNCSAIVLATTSISSLVKADREGSHDEKVRILTETTNPKTHKYWSTKPSQFHCSPSQKSGCFPSNCDTNFSYSASSSGVISGCEGTTVVFFFPGETFLAPTTCDLLLCFPWLTIFPALHADEDAAAAAPHLSVS